MQRVLARCHIVTQMPPIGKNGELTHVPALKE